VSRRWENLVVFFRHRFSSSLSFIWRLPTPFSPLPPNCHYDPLADKVQDITLLNPDDVNFFARSFKRGCSLCVRYYRRSLLAVLSPPGPRSHATLSLRSPVTILFTSVFCHSFTPPHSNSRPPPAPIASYSLY